MMSSSWENTKRPPWQSSQAQRLEVRRAQITKEVNEREKAAAAASSSDPTTWLDSPVTPGASLPPTVEKDLEEFKAMTQTPLSFQPHRHVFFIAGRPCVVPSFFCIT